MANLNYANLERLQEWQLVLQHAEKLIYDYTNEIITLAEDGKTAQMCERAGRIAGLKELISYPKDNFTGGKNDA